MRRSVWTECMLTNRLEKDNMHQTTIDHWFCFSSCYFHSFLLVFFFYFFFFIRLRSNEMKLFVWIYVAFEEKFTIFGKKIQQITIKLQKWKESAIINQSKLKKKNVLIVHKSRFFITKRYAIHCYRDYEYLNQNLRSKLAWNKTWNLTKFS